MKQFLPVDTGKLEHVVESACPYGPDEIDEIDFRTMSTGSLLTLYRMTIDSLEAIERSAKRFSKLKGKLSESLLDKLQSEGVDKLSNEAISVSVTTRDTVKIEGDWEQIQRKLVEVGLGYATHKKLSAGKLREAFDAGVRLPEGLELGQIQQLSHRRKK